MIRMFLRLDHAQLLSPAVAKAVRIAIIFWGSGLL